MGVILLQTNTSNEVTIKSGGDNVSGQGETKIKVRGSLPTLFPWCQRGREKMVLPSMPKGEIVGNMALRVGIDVNTVTWLALQYVITYSHYMTVISIMMWGDCWQWQIGIDVNICKIWLDEMIAIWQSFRDDSDIVETTFICWW